MSSSPPTPSFAPSPSYASAAATQQQLNSTAPPPGLSPPPGIDPSRRKMSAPEPSIRIALVDRSDAPKPMTSALSGKPPGLSSHADSARLSAAAQSRSRSPSPGKWANSRLPHKKPADGDHPSSSRPQSQQSAHPLSPEPPSDSLTNEEAEDLVLSRKRRNRTSSTPNALVVDGDPSNVVPDVSKTGARRGSHAPPSQKWNAGLGGWSNTPTIWKEGGDAPAASKVPTFLGPDPSQYRRFSYTVEKDGDDSKRHVLRQPLRGDDEEDQGLDTGKSRSRPKSSSSASGSAVEGKAPESGPRRSSGASNYSEFSSIWASSREQGDNAESPASQRRGSLQPSSRGGWGESAPPVDHLSPFAHTLGLPSKLQQRRLSHSPNLFSDAPTKRLNRSSPDGEPPSADSRRRHSLAGPLVINDALEQLEGMNIEETPIYADINEYFENTEYRTRAWVEAGKNLQMQSSAQEQWPIFVVEFKAGRIDYFYNPAKVSASSATSSSDDSGVSASEMARIRVGDLVIVEADRGKDLGKVICDSIMNQQQLQQFRAQHRDLLLDTHADREIQLKRIYKPAYPNEIAMLVAKSQDEAKATSVCQAKIRQRKLPMEIVDAEYQWDRRKLTFFFVAERRIDFRDLVKDLFKLYKTRIWMCAVDPGKYVR